MGDPMGKMGECGGFQMKVTLEEVRGAVDGSITREDGLFEGCASYKLGVCRIWLYLAVRSLPLTGSQSSIGSQYLHWEQRLSDPAKMLQANDARL